MQQIEVSKLKPHPKLLEFFEFLNNEQQKDFYLQEYKDANIPKLIIITNNFEVISGWEEFEISKNANMLTIPVEIREYESDEDIISDILFLNIEYISHIKSRVKRVQAATIIHSTYKEKQELEKNRRKNICKEYRKNIIPYRTEILIDHSHKCDICGMDCRVILIIHHALPLSEGGNNNSDNIMVVCPNCHAILHKIISFFWKGDPSEEDTKDFNDMFEWIENNYTKKAYECFMDMFNRYLKLKRKYRWSNING